MTEDPEQLKTGRLSSRISTMAGPHMKSLSSLTDLLCWRNLPTAASGASCPQSRANTLFQTHRDEDDAPEKESAPSFPLSRPSRCCTVVMVVVVISNKNRHKNVIDSIDPIWDPKGVRN